MKFQVLAPLAFVATSEALNLLAGLDIDLPLGIDLGAVLDLGLGPKEGPPDGCTNVWHPPHHGVDMDDCDNDEDDGWHYVHPGQPHYPGNGPHTWGTSTVYATETSTYYGCPPDVPDCPAGSSTHYTTVTCVESTTICPIEVTTTYATPTSVFVPPTTVVPPVEETPCPPTTTYAPPVWTPTMTTVVVVTPPVVESPPPAGTPPIVTQPPAVSPPPAVPTPPYGAGNTTVPGTTQVYPPPPVVTAGAAQNVQRVGVAVVGLVAAALL